ncbi:type II secretion system protein M [Marinimicrobium sp. C6131]|uniref:MSHA biogenesis protein MshJ n=1 Tax=Marinimicrobium sp. C6131 TaxID=3022676 RepID=UPI00223DAAD7|nr:MSHA biogenesis protein MshJ [Marinimicrobium sp. C6131]UZJ45929.1 type II secretion system protein M [Marinimicrobium sp. C6131]
MTEWQQTWQRWSERVEAYSLRERVLLLLCVIAVLIGLWQWLVALPEERQREQIEQQRTAVANDRGAQQAQLAALMSTEADSRPAQELAQLQRTLDELDESLASLSQGLVSADQLPQILQEVLISTTELRLRRVRTLPVEELPLSGTTGEAENAESAHTATGVFRHSVELEVSGDFFEVLSFLRRLEGLPWRFYWDRLDYEVADYPVGDIRLRVYTLSAEEGLLGV